ncbi:MAG: hypothetical protein ACREJ5_02980 [Geminicoccaceae bacterium]
MSPRLRLWLLFAGLAVISAAALALSERAVALRQRQAGPVGARLRSKTALIEGAP